MKGEDNATGHPEIVIVRRRGGDDGAAGKGGAWKIAYADFVTAMMAFFLVMWLINASNEETRAQVASYFNPIKLTDTSTGTRSLKDMKDTHNPQSTDHGELGEGSPPSKQDVRSEAELLANPPASLDRMAKSVSEADFRNAGLDNEVEIAPAIKPDPSNPGVGDPFDPRAWEKAAREAPPGAELAAAEQEPAETEPQETAAEAAPKARGTEATPRAPGAEGEAEQRTAQAEAEAIAKDIAARLGPDDQNLQRSLSVEPRESGILISLTEQENFEMFETGSAEPRPEALKLVEAIAASVKSHEGFLVIRGHTDSRPFRNKYYDNWQLSTARAHFARYMLVRGGLDEKRIVRIEGVADREPRNPEDPQAAENRRIEILLGTGQP